MKTLNLKPMYLYPYRINQRTTPAKMDFEMDQTQALPMDDDDDPEEQSPPDTVVSKKAII